MSSSSLSIAVLGVGNIGSAFAFQLVRTGKHQVTTIARPNSLRFEQLNRDNAIVNIKDERAEVRVLDALDEETPYDLVIVTLLAHQIDVVVSALQRSVAKSIQFMSNNFDPERLRDIIGAERCSFGMPFVQSIINEEGKLNVTIGMKSMLSDQNWVDVYIAAGLPAVFEPNMLLWLRCHVPLCIAFESVSIAGMRRRSGASWNESMVVARGVKEIVTLIKALGYSIYPGWLDYSPEWMMASMLWFMSRNRSFREVLSTGRAECCALIDVLVSAASQINPPISVTKIQAMKPPE